VPDARSTTEVIQDHLSNRLRRDAKTDLRNYSDDVILLTGSGRYDGHDGLSAAAAELKRLVGDGAQFTYNETLIAGPYAFLQWSAYDEGEKRVTDGADSFVVHDGLIVLQTIHYTPK
jgi:hypothetical protein